MYATEETAEHSKSDFLNQDSILESGLNEDSSYIVNKQLGVNKVR